jgi:trehalose 6-phosphate synthase
VLVPDENPRYVLKRVKLSEEEVTGYYRGFSNRVLWPLFHLFMEKMHLKERYWQAYYGVNKKFARAVVEEMEENDFIWVHDYHLALLPRFVKEERSDARIAFFWHIPWPPWEVFGTLPRRNEMLTGMLNSDLVGFHTSSYVRNFMGCAMKQPDVKLDLERNIVYNSSQKTKVQHFPLGISYKNYADSAERSHIIQKAVELKKMYKAEHLVLGIDRLDYTKGILHRLKAFEYFLEHNPDARGKVVLVQVASPSRYAIEEYHEMKKEIDETVGRINGRFRSEEWTPVMYFYKKIPQDLLLAYYRAADVGLLSPLRDGMNLIAKEFAASKKEQSVLILSEFAGASEELDEAIIVNPFDIPGTADAIKTAVGMSDEEKKRRFHSIKEKVKTHDSRWWLNSFMNAWEKLYA